MAKLKSLSAVETRTLLSRYFEKVVELRDSDRKKNLHCSELKVRPIIKLTKWNLRLIAEMIFA